MDDLILQPVSYTHLMQNTATPLALEDSTIARAILQMVKAACGKSNIPEKKKGFSFFR